MVWLDYHNGVIIVKNRNTNIIDVDRIWILVLALVKFKRPAKTMVYIIEKR